MMRRFLLLAVALCLAACDRAADQSPDPAANIEPSQTAQNAIPLGGAELFTLACQGCHDIEAGLPHRVGPNLAGIVGQPAASQEAFSYSPALQESGLVWTEANLAAWVVAGESLVPGTWMLYHNILNPDEVRQLIGYIGRAGSIAQP